MRAKNGGAIGLSENVLITGGAGFIGSHLSRRLLERGYHVRALDNLTQQVHGNAARPAYLPEEVELMVGDVRDRDVVGRALQGIDAVVHLAARVGVGQSMYEIAEYASANTFATGMLLEAMMDHPVRKLLVASSMSVYGEGLYRNRTGRASEATERDRAQLERGAWDPVGADGQSLEPLPTPETKPVSLSSIYALGKYDQERMCLLYGSAYGVPTVALRFFNVYGPDQALSNPYTGVLAIFANRLLNDLPPLIYEDGGQRRDFVRFTTWRMPRFWRSTIRGPMVRCSTSAAARASRCARSPSGSERSSAKSRSTSRSRPSTESVTYVTALPTSVAPVP